MVDALVSFALENLGTLITDEVKFLKDVTKELEQLSGTFTAIQAVLDDAEMKRVMDKSAGMWAEKLKDVAYDVDDVLDEWMIETHRLRMDDSHEASGQKVCLFFPSSLSSRNIKLRRRLGKKIMEIKKRLSEIREEESQFKFLHGRPIEMESRLTFSEINETKIFGRNRDREIIIGQLLGCFAKEADIPILSIVGMGGLGKTTLAQLLYNDTRAKNHFDKRMWVCVSSNFDVHRIGNEIIDAFQRETGFETSATDALESLRYRLRKVLDGKRFLLVLDDVWHEDEESWETLMLLLKGGAPGSRIIATTRNEKVALKMRATCLHYLDAMSLADSWLLFSQRAFHGRTREECSMLEETGKEIVKKCRGVPLAVKTVGSALRFQRTNDEWERVLKSKTWDLQDVEEGIYPALLLSYYYLPSHLKQCFVYSSLFPKGWVIEKDMLVKLWAAQGFIRSKGSREMEEIGREYFEDLLGRSFFENSIKDDEGNITTCKMHELMHDLAQFVSKGEFSIDDTVRPSQIQARHSSIIGVHGKIFVANYRPEANKLRSLLFIGESDFSELPPTLFHGLRRIRTLCCGNNCIERLPSSIGKMIHIRHLDFSHTLIQELPEAMTNLSCLQTLRLNGCFKLHKLPTEMRRLISLRHLEIEGTPQLCLPEQIGKLTALRTLSKFTEQGKSGYSVKELKELNLLHGKLEILNLELVRSGDEAKEAGLVNKQHLHALYLSCKNTTTDDIKNLPGGENDVARIQSVFESLRPHKNLKILRIMNYSGNEHPSWLVDSVFCNLNNVELSGFICKQLPALGQLPALRYLLIQKMPNVKSVGIEFIGARGGFRKLEKLVFAHMHEWVEWHLHREDQALQNLSSLEFHHCRKLKALPECIPERLKELSIEECNEFGWHQRLPQLEKLSLDGSVGKFTKSLPSLPNLENLEIFGAQKMKSLPDGLLELKELQTLNISFCQQVSVLPKGMKRLSKLKKLTIRRCPILSERCQKDSGEDWKKISFIPTIEIDWKKIQRPLPLESQFW
ncbi:putative disease resistance protein RGA3 [Aristolochia californica]|uniref:putative disease resistance protein RGA3 n=1 Tax=Aristolochia californica TaxID=171875 RepID=UPI0035D8FB77